MNLGGLEAAAIQLAYAVAIALTFPFQFLPGVRLIEECVFGFSSGHSALSRSVVRSAVCVVLLGVAYVFESKLDNFVSLVGCFCGVPLAFLYPAISSALWRRRAKQIRAVGGGHDVVSTTNVEGSGNGGSEGASRPTGPSERASSSTALRDSRSRESVAGENSGRFSLLSNIFPCGVDLTALEIVLLGVGSFAFVCSSAVNIHKIIST